MKRLRDLAIGGWMSGPRPLRRVSFLLTFAAGCASMPAGAQTAANPYLDLESISPNIVFGPSQQAGGLFLQGGFNCAVQAGAVCTTAGGTPGGYLGVVYNSATNTTSIADGTVGGNAVAQAPLTYAGGANQIGFTTATSYYDRTGAFGNNPALYGTGSYYYLGGTNNTTPTLWNGGGTVPQANLVNDVNGASQWSYVVHDVTSGQYLSTALFQPSQNPSALSQLIVPGVELQNGTYQLATPTPFVQNVTYSVSGGSGGIATPTFNWSQATTAQGTAFAPDVQRIEIWQLNGSNPSTAIYQATLSGTATSYTVPSTFTNLTTGLSQTLVTGQEYSIDIEAETLRNPGNSADTTNDNLLSRSRALFNFTPQLTAQLLSDQGIALAMVDNSSGTTVYKFNQTVAPGSTLTVDPQVAVGYRYQIGAHDSNFTSVTLPTVGSGVYQLYLLSAGGQWTDAATLYANQTYSFASGGVSSFEVEGIDPNAGLNPSDASAFQTQLTFAAGGDGEFTGTMTPLTADSNSPVPLPAAIWLMLGGMGGLGVFARHRKTVVPSAI